MSRRPRVRAVLQLAATGLAVLGTAVLASQPASGAFTTRTDDTANSATAAADFCPSGSGTATLTGDTWIDEAAPGSTHATEQHLYIRSSSTGDRRALLTFTLPSKPAACSVTAATLALYDNTPTSGRTIEVYRIDPAASWDPATVTWTTRPAVLGTPATSTTPSGSSTQQWTVTGLVQDLYAAGNNGVLLKDQTEGGSGAVNRYDADENPSTRQASLTVSWG